MQLNLGTMPTWTVLLAELVALVLLGVTLWFIAKPVYRLRIPVVLAVIALMAVLQTRIQERSSRVAAWLVVVASLSFALSALYRRGRLYAEYYRIEEKYGPKSKEMKTLVMKMVTLLIVIMIILLVLSGVFIKGVYTQGT